MRTFIALIVMCLAAVFASSGNLLPASQSAAIALQPSPPPSPPSPSPTLPPTTPALPSAAPSLPAPAPATQPAAQPPTTNRLLIVSIDGARPDLLMRANMPAIRTIIRQGSYSLWARTTPAAVTLPSHTSMLTGVIIPRHQITWNGSLPFKEPVYPAFPTLFELAKSTGYTTALVAGKDKMDTLLKPGTVDFSWITPQGACSDAEVAANAVKIISSHKPQVMFVHFPQVDSTGHAKGWGSPEQIAAFEEADRHLASVINAIQAAGHLQSTYIIISADHGGAGKTHGADDPRSRHIPWIIAGPGVRQNYDLTRHADLDVQTYDTFATACALLKIRLTKPVDGRFVIQAFEANELLR